MEKYSKTRFLLLLAKRRVEMSNICSVLICCFDRQMLLTSINVSILMQFDPAGLLEPFSHCGLVTTKCKSITKNHSPMPRIHSQSTSTTCWWTGIAAERWGRGIAAACGSNQLNVVSARLLGKKVRGRRRPRPEKKERKPSEKTMGCHCIFDARPSNNDQKISVWKISLIGRGSRTVTSLPELTDLPDFSPFF